MELEFTKEKETPLLSRKRVTVKATFEGKTPSRLELKKEIAKKTKTDPELVVVRHIYQRFGAGLAKIIVHVYKDRKMLEKLEGDYIVKKHVDKKPSDVIKKKPAKKEEKKEEKAEEKKVEKKTEAKKEEKKSE